MSRFERLNTRGEKIAAKVYRAGDVTLTVTSAGDFRTIFLSQEEAWDLAQFLLTAKVDEPFVETPVFSGPDPYVMSWETAPMVPTVRRE